MRGGLRPAHPARLPRVRGLPVCRLCSRRMGVGRRRRLVRRGLRRGCARRLRCWRGASIEGLDRGPVGRGRVGEGRVCVAPVEVSRQLVARGVEWELERTFAVQSVNVTVEPAQLRTSVANRAGSGSSYCIVSLGARSGWRPGHFVQCDDH